MRSTVIAQISDVQRQPHLYGNHKRHALQPQIYKDQQLCQHIDEYTVPKVFVSFTTHVRVYVTRAQLPWRPLLLGPRVVQAACKGRANFDLACGRRTLIAYTTIVRIVSLCDETKGIDHYHEAMYPSNEQEKNLFFC
ncbi:unnamed protein product [Ceratitis capitata]|uniref:(Mediterranean fruit fly) hypothetical protein n=1 Tax=Ceratitis capitata TaxID=7213 RepID=A0A811VIE6_CERCA|nr:unnamed protein product [Ceratitis capitata]